MDYRERHVIVTGGTGALGVAVVEALLDAGAICHVPFRSGAAAERMSQHKHPRLQLISSASVADEREVERIYSGVPDLWAAIHVAGGFAFGPIAEVSKVQLMEQLETNFISCFLCCRAAIMAMTATGRGGRIVNVAARPALEWRSGARMSAYTASKAAVAAFTAAIAEEVAGQGILVSAVAPSILDTPQNRKSMPKADHEAWPKVDEVASTILFLASPENRVTRGAIVPVYGRV
ncbi:MAG TPA: SDR family NAD(P)-dependent oxidoreductase [Alphaproteobacteria bacterium]